MKEREDQSHATKIFVISKKCIFEIDNLSYPKDYICFIDDYNGTHLFESKEDYCGAKVAADDNDYTFVLSQFNANPPSVGFCVEPYTTNEIDC